MKRRDLFLVAGAALAWPCAAGAEESSRRIGLLLAGQPRSSPTGVAYEARMRELGYVDGQNLAMIFRDAEGHAERMPQIAAELVGQKPAVIVAVGPEASLRAVRAATTSIPIVMVAIDYDPVARGYVTSLARPTDNITGVFAQQIELAAKRLEVYTSVAAMYFIMLYPMTLFAKRLGVRVDQ